MKCAFAFMFHLQHTPCIGEECSMWDSDHNTCLATSFMRTYEKQLTTNLQLLQWANRMEARVDRDLDE